MKKRWLSLLLCGALLFSLCTPAAAAETETETEKYLTWDDAQKTLVEKDIPTSITQVTTGTTELNSTTTDGWYIVRGNIEISSRVTVTGDAHLILADGYTLEAMRGIGVGAGNSLTIYGQQNGTGKLTATGGGNQAGIGGSNSYEAGGTVTINGGTVTANGGYLNAGIGGGQRGSGGTVTINGGTVTANGSDVGAGIGGGQNGAGGTITINGGEVTATSNGYGAGIGSGYGGSGGTITINGGKVNATGEFGAGIGGGEDGDSGGKITINGGEVTATCNRYGAGIGGGYGGAGGTITISGGKVTATNTSGDGAGIGGGDGGGAGGTIIISGGEVTATSNGYGAGIGGGYLGAGGTITINGGKVNATGEFGAGIGGGHNGEGGQITISGGEVTATSNGYGAGIGGGNGGNGGTIIISGGTVNATATKGGAGIGGGTGDDSGGAGGEIAITGGTVTATGNGNSAGIGGGENGGSGSFSTGTDGNAFIAASSMQDQSGKSSGWSGVIFEGDSGNIYNSPITLTTDVEIPAGKELEIGEGQTLIIGQGVTLTNNGSIIGSGMIVNNGTITGKAIGGSVVTHSGKAEWSSDASSHWHPCTVADCTENHQFDKEAHIFGAWITDTEATAVTAGSKHRVCTICQYQETQTIPATGGGSGGGGGGSGSYTPPTTPTYPPTVEKPGEGGGTPSISPSNPARGDTVTVTPKPDEGYEVDKITVTDRNSRPVEVTKKPDGTYTFKQPSGQVTIEIEYAPVPLTDLPWNNPFTDVSESDWYYEAVRFVQERGLMNGYSDGRFAPEDTLSRAQLAQILFNKEGQPAGNGQSDFTDVSGGAWYSAAVCWAVDQGIVGGYGNGTFGPNDPITREQLAVMLWRYVGSPAATDKQLHFNDVDEISPFAREAMRWAVENGILNGYGDGQLGPQGQATRAQVAQMLKNFIENIT